MGQTLPGHVTEKSSGGGASPSQGLEWSFSTMKGWRPTMEDAHFEAVAPGSGAWADTAAFGVLDGHGGSGVAHFCRERLPRELAAKRGEDWQRDVVEAFEHMDELLAKGNHCVANVEWSGSTALLCAVSHDALLVANAGDSRAVLCRGGQAVQLTEDHKPDLPSERERVQHAGGFVQEQQVGPITLHRVNGGLSVSRAIGDLSYKGDRRLTPAEQLICATPSVEEVPREAADEFLILACDGVWDVISNQDAVDFVRERLHGGQQLEGIAEDLLEHCLSPDLSETDGLGGDNMTVILVRFLCEERTINTSAPEEKAVEEMNEDCAKALQGENVGMNLDEAFVNVDDGRSTPRTKKERCRLDLEVSPYFF